MSDKKLCSMDGDSEKVLMLIYQQLKEKKDFTDENGKKILPIVDIIYEKNFNSLLVLSTIPKRKASESINSYFQNKKMFSLDNFIQ